MLLDAQGRVRAGVVDAAAPPARQALQLAQRLQAMGVPADEAASTAMAAVGRTLSPAASAALAGPAAGEVVADARVVITGQQLPADALGNRYEADGQGRVLVHLAGGGMVSLGAAAVPVLDGLALPGASVLRTLAQVAGQPALAAASLLAVPGNLGQAEPAVDLARGLRFQPPRPGEVFGQLLEQQPGGSWEARPERFVRQPTADGAGFVILGEHELRRLQAPMATPAEPPPRPTVLPLPAWLERHEVVPPYRAETPPPGLPGREAEPPQRAEDLLIDSRSHPQKLDDAMQAWRNNPALRHPGTLLGLSEGGPGTWALSDKRSGGEAYQEQVTGVPRGVEYQVNGVWFDGYDASRNVLVDAKDWMGYPPADRDFWHDKTIEEARRQVGAVGGTGTRIEWHVATQEAADALNALFDRDRDLSGIRIVVVPKE